MAGDEIVAAVEHDRGSACQFAQARRPCPLVVLFHGGGGSAERILPMLEAHARAARFLLLVPQSLFPTWDIVIAGHGPTLFQGLEPSRRLELVSTTRLKSGQVAMHYRRKQG